LPVGNPAVLAMLRDRGVQRNEQHGRVVLATTAQIEPDAKHACRLDVRRCEPVSGGIVVAAR
jgi:hypothetical protein